MDARNFRFESSTLGLVFSLEELQGALAVVADLAYCTFQFSKTPLGDLLKIVWVGVGGRHENIVFLL
jgi:hypothetical protein